MESKFGTIIDSIRNMNSHKIADVIKKNKENLTPITFVNFARKAVSTAKSFSMEEMKIISEKFNAVGQKTSCEIEKVVKNAVNKIIDGQVEDKVTDDVRDEIVHMFVEHDHGKNILPIVKYVNNVLVSNVPTSFQAAMNFRRNVAQTLVKDAKNRLKKHNIVDAQVIKNESM